MPLALGTGVVGAGLPGVGLPQIQHATRVIWRGPPGGAGPSGDVFSHHHRSEPQSALVPTATRLRIVRGLTESRRAAASTVTRRRSGVGTTGNAAGTGRWDGPGSTGESRRGNERRCPRKARDINTEPWSSDQPMQGCVGKPCLKRMLGISKI